LSLFFVFAFAGGVLQTTGASDVTPIYYTPFFGVAFFQFLNMAVTRDVPVAVGHKLVQA
jgi:hypothetical protein